MSIQRLHHAQITIPRGAETAGRAFYVGVLGLREIKKPESLQGRGGFWLALGDAQIHVGVEDGFDRYTTKAHLAYEVDDLSAWRQRLQQHDITVEESAPIPGYERFEFRDPFGNRVELIQPIALAEQLDYYRARADEYDEWFYRQGRYDHKTELNERWFAEVEQVRAQVHRLGPVTEALELACGTGIWTAELATLADHVTAIDAAAEVIAINRRKVAADHVMYQQLDLFAWEPQQTYDLVFFAFWLSHVPPERLRPFLSKVYRAVKPGGRMFMIDSRPDPASGAINHERPNPDDIFQQRKLNDGRSFSIYKVYYEPAALVEELQAVGFAASAQTTPRHFIYAEGRRP